MNLSILSISDKWNHIIQTFRVWLLLLNILFSRLTYAVAWVLYSFLWLSSISLYGYIQFYLSFHWLINIWAISNCCYYMWILLLWTFYASFCLNTHFNSRGYILRVRLRHNANTMFNFLKSLQTNFHSTCILHSHQQCMRVLIFIHPCQYLFSSSF